MEAVCQLCGHVGEMRLWSPRHRIVECPSCSLVFYEGEIDPASFYNGQYFCGGGDFDYLGGEKGLRRNFARRGNELRQLLPSGRPLEIGTAFGFFLDEAKNYYDVRGLDISQEAVARCVRQGLNVQQTDFLSLPEEPDTYDIICLWDTIEHLPRPFDALAKAARWLKPSGFLCLTTGDVRSRMAKLQKERWRQIHPPTHLFYFSKTTLSRALTKAGLEICRISYPGISRSLLFMVHKIALRKGWPPWFCTLLTAGGSINFSIYLNTFDLLSVVAKKPGSQ